MKPVKLEKEEVEELKEMIECYLLEMSSSLVPKERKLCEKIIKKLNNSLKPPIKTSSRKAKGRNFQYWVCQKIAERFEVEYKQADDDCLIHSREMGQHHEDIILRGELKHKFPFCIECKNQENLSVKDWINQSKSNQKENMEWMLVFKNKEITPVVCLDFETFLKYYKEIEK